MKRLIYLLLALLVAGSASAAMKVQVMTGGKIDVDKLPTISFFQEGDPASPELGQIWWNNATNQLKIAGVLGVYAFNSTSLVNWDTTPAAFSFADVTNATTGVEYTSNQITVSGINWPASISVSGHASAKYSVNNATATEESGTVKIGDEVRAVVTASVDDGTAVNATVTIGGVSDVFTVTTTAVAASYIVDESFEGTGTPASWSDTLNANFDYTANPLSGSQSLRLGNGVNFSYATAPTFDAQAVVYASFMYRQEALDSTWYDILRMRSGPTDNVGLVTVSSTGTVRLNCGTASTISTGSLISAGVDYYVWVKLDVTQKNVDFYISTTSTRPTSPSLSLVGGNTTFTSVDRVQLRNPPATYNVFDNLKISGGGW